MATVSDRPRARRARQPQAPAVVPVAEAPPPPWRINDRPEEGWEPGGGAAPVPAKPAPTKPAAPAKAPSPPAPQMPAAIARHGKCSIVLGIDGTAYRLRPAKAGPPIEGVVTIERRSETSGAAYAVATDGLDIRCTCPDHERRGARCKQIGRAHV